MRSIDLRILQMNLQEMTGGAARIAWNLHRAYSKRGVRSWMAVGRKETNDASVLLIPNDRARGLWKYTLLKTSDKLRAANTQIRGTWLLGEIIRWIAEPTRQWHVHQGIEDFHFPGSSGVLELPPERPDILHCHNLHSGYFDLLALPQLCGELPTVLTLHDAWLLSGHCAHSFDCELWKTGCGTCPDLTIYPAIRRDATGYNWQRKRRIYERSRLYVVTPSRWLMQKVFHSILAPAVIEARVIPNGVDLSIFRPTNKETARMALGIPNNCKVILFGADSIKKNKWRDYETMRAVISVVAERINAQELFLLALGEKAPTQRIGQATMRFVPPQKDQEAVARCYQAADVYVHASRADTFPNMILEALACGAPVVATDVGGIPEQVEDGATGFLVPLGDVQAMAIRIEQLIGDDELRRKMGVEATEFARKVFSLDTQVDAYLEWFLEIVNRNVSLRD